MKNTGVIRRLDELGRIVIPSTLRKDLGLETGTKLEIYVQDDFISLIKYDDTENNHMSLTRSVDELGRIVLPMSIRDKYDLIYKTPFEIYLDETINGILLKKFHQTCIFCNSNKNLIEYNGKLVCSNCIHNLVSTYGK